MFKPGDFASESVQLECLPDGGFVCSILVFTLREWTWEEATNATDAGQPCGPLERREDSSKVRTMT